MLASGCHLNRDGARNPRDSGLDASAAFAQGLRARHPQCAAQPQEELTYSVVCGGRRVGVDLHDLAAGFGELNAFERGQAVDRFLDRFDTTLEAETLDRGAVLASVVPLVRSRNAMRAQLRARHYDRENGPAIAPYVGDLVIVFALEMPSSIRSLTRATRNELPVADRELLNRASTNLLDHIQNISRWDGEAVTMLTAGGQYESSLMLVDALWEELEVQVSGELVVAVPSRDVLLFGGTGNPDTLPALRQAIARVQEDGGYLVSEHVYRWTRGRWAVFEESK